MYAIGTSFAHPVYTRVWVGESGDVIVGDFDRSIFTFSKKGKLGKTCLLTDTIINFMVSLPDSATITALGNSYRVDVKCDAFEYAAEFTPKYESDPGVGSYASDSIFAMAQKDENNFITVPVESLKKIMAQAGILAASGEIVTHMTYADSELRIYDNNIDCQNKVDGTCYNFSLDLNSELFRSSIGNIDADSIKIAPMKQEDTVVGICIFTDNMSIVLGGLE